MDDDIFVAMTIERGTKGGNQNFAARLSAGNNEKVRWGDTVPMRIIGTWIL